MTTLLVDVGASGVRILVLGDQGTRTPVERDSRSAAEGLDELVSSVAFVVARHGLTSVDTVAAGVSGVHGVVPDLDVVGAELHRSHRLQELVVADDSLPWAIGALGGRPGVMVALGTGAVTLAIGPRGRTARVDGAGPYLGDRGSGWWIGRQGLIAAMSAAEARRGGSAALLTLAEERFGDLKRLPQQLRQAAHPHALVASFAADVTTAARQGDELSLGILHAAGGHVGTAVAAAARTSGLNSPFTLVLVGGVSEARELLAPGLDETLTQEALSAVHATAEGDALAGTERLVDQSVSWAGELARRWSARPTTVG